MPKYCAESCRKWADRNNFGGPKTVYLDLDDGDDTFYDLQAKLYSTKKKIDFDRFDGYVSTSIVFTTTYYVLLVGSLEFRIG